MGEGREGSALFGRVGELVLAAPVVALLDARVCPQRPDGGRVRRVDRDGHRLRVDHADGFRELLPHRTTRYDTHQEYEYSSSR